VQKKCSEKDAAGIFQCKKISGKFQDSGASGGKSVKIRQRVSDSEGSCTSQASQHPNVCYKNNTVVRMEGNPLSGAL
jgi:hypothetical protein